jgi:DNA repair protein RadC
MPCFQRSEELPPRSAKLNRLIQSRDTETLEGGPQAVTETVTGLLPSASPRRPRRSGANPRAMTDAEALAAVLRLPEGAEPRANELLTRYGSLSALSRCTVQEIAAYPAIGVRRALQLVAAFSLGPRISRERYTRRRLDSPELVYDLMALEMQQLHKESLRVILLDTRYRFLWAEEVSLGSVNESIAHPRDVFRPAIIASAYAVIVAHNHPSGDPSPSQSDHSLTRRLAEAAELLQIKLLDHVIIGVPAEGRQAYFSFKEAGVL